MAHQLLNVKHTGNPRLDLMLCGIVCMYGVGGCVCDEVCVCGKGGCVCVVWEGVCVW